MLGVQDHLFEMLDPSIRRLRFPREREAIITDTVGFMNKPSVRGTTPARPDRLMEASVGLVVISPPGYHPVVLKNKIYKSFVVC